MGYAYLNKGVHLSAIDWSVAIIHWSNISCLWGTFQISGCLWHAGPLNTSGIGCSAKTFNRWLPSNVCVGKLRLTVTGTWVLLWSDVSLIWYQHIVIFILATVFSSWFPSKDIQLQALMKALVVFRWLMFHIILLCSLVNRHQAYIINCSHGEKCFTGAVILLNNI